MPESQTAPAPTEDQVKAANEAEFKRWEGDFDPKSLEVKYSHDDLESDGEESENDDSSDKQDDQDEVEEVATHSDPEPVVTVDDPGEYKPADYSFKIDIKGKTHTIESSDKAAEIAEEFADDLTAKQLVSLVTKGSRIDIKEAQDREKWEAQKKTFDEQSATADQRQETVASMASEFDYLVKKGLMPAIDKKHLDADWSDPEVAKQPGVKEQIALLNYMVKENEVRVKAKVKPLVSIVDAFNAWQQDSGRKKDEADKKNAGEARKAASARVAGVSASNQAPYVPKGIAVGNPNVFKRNQAVWDN